MKLIKVYLVMDTGGLLHIASSLELAIEYIQSGMNDPFGEMSTLDWDRCPLQIYSREIDGPLESQFLLLSGTPNEFAKIPQIVIEAANRPLSDELVTEVQDIIHKFNEPKKNEDQSELEAKLFAWDDRLMDKLADWQLAIYEANIMKLELNREWFEGRINAEDNCEIGAGGPERMNMSSNQDYVEKGDSDG